MPLYNLSIWYGFTQGIGSGEKKTSLHRFSFKRRRSSLCNGGAALDNFPFLRIRHGAVKTRIASLLASSVQLPSGIIRIIPQQSMGIDVDAVINESENSLFEPSVQFVTLSSVVGEEAIPTYSVATSQTFRRVEVQMAERRCTLRP